ncbi:hypothetical protein C6A85_71770, partial [Mycobacterium sp. ITM-2017-0098]
ADGAPVGVVRLAARDLAHLLDTAALFVGWLWPLWDRRRRTFATSLRISRWGGSTRRTSVRASRSAKVLIAAAVVCVAAAGLGYASVYRHERAVDAARDQIAQEGPR